jgi:catechol 2,3-dioxygenase-like lactoylglutathione lyase family enzyme
MKIDHMIMRGSDPEKVIEFYDEVFGFELVGKSERESFTLYFLEILGQDAKLELTYNHGENKIYETGEGFGHIAIQTPSSRLSSIQSLTERTAWKYSTLTARPRRSSISTTNWKEANIQSQ